MLQQRYSVRGIARVLGLCASTISREIARNRVPDQGYASKVAQQRSEQRRRCARLSPKLHLQGHLWQLVIHFLRFRWSLEQIALTLSHLYPKGHELRVSHESIYNCIYAQPVGDLRKELIVALRQAKNKRLPRSKSKDRRGQIPDMLSIHMRSLEVVDRQCPGHWQRQRCGYLGRVHGSFAHTDQAPRIPACQCSQRHASLQAEAAEHCPAHVPKPDVRAEQSKEMAWTKGSPRKRAWRCTSVIRTALGSEAPMRIRMAL